MNTMHELTGKCHEMSIKLCEDDPSLELVRGYYYCQIWGERQHWWCKDKEGNIIDATKDQFPSKGYGVYKEFDGTVACENCGEIILEEDGHPIGRYLCCSQQCCKQLVGL